MREKDESRPVSSICSMSVCACVTGEFQTGKQAYKVCGECWKEFNERRNESNYEERVEVERR